MRIANYIFVIVGLGLTSNLCFGDIDDVTCTALVKGAFPGLEVAQITHVYPSNNPQVWFMLGNLECAAECETHISGGGTCKSIAAIKSEEINNYNVFAFGVATNGQGFHKFYGHGGKMGSKKSVDEVATDLGGIRPSHP
jgi:hypothetical protein